MNEKPRLVAAGVFYCSTRPLSRNCEYPYLVYLIGLAAIGSSSGPAVPRQKWVGHVKEKTMNIEKYSERVRGFIQSAQSYALAEGHQQPKVTGGNGQLYLSQPLAKVFPVRRGTRQEGR
jgi:hypothetical protein